MVRKGRAEGGGASGRVLAGGRRGDAGGGAGAAVAGADTVAARRRRVPVRLGHAAHAAPPRPGLSPTVTGWPSAGLPGVVGPASAAVFARRRADAAGASPALADRPGQPSGRRPAVLGPAAPVAGGDALRR